MRGYYFYFCMITYVAAVPAIVTWAPLAQLADLYCRVAIMPDAYIDPAMLAEYESAVSMLPLVGLLVFVTWVTMVAAVTEELEIRR